MAETSRARSALTRDLRREAPSASGCPRFYSLASSPAFSRRRRFPGHWP